MMQDYKCPYCGHGDSLYVETSEPKCSALIECSCCGGFYKVVVEMTFKLTVIPINQNQGKSL